MTSTMNIGNITALNHAAEGGVDTAARRQTARNEYLLGKSASEPERLIQQAELHRPEARQLIERAGVKPGAHALDLGCGPLGILDELAMRVGVWGKVVGLEREERFRTHAAATLQRKGLANVNLTAGDARDTQLPAGQFDFSHARLLLVNVPRPQEVVDEMVRVTKPGGVVALHEVDWGSWKCEPMVESWTRLKNAASEVWEQNGLDVNIGRRLPDMLRQTGLSDINIQIRTYAWRSGDQKHSFLLALLERIRKDIVNCGLLSSAEISRFEHELKAHLADPTTVVLSPAYFQVWGRKTTPEVGRNPTKSLTSSSVQLSRRANTHSPISK
jgi:SAM-dependent methyltransferase